ncbi:MAG: hypothetical protein ACE5HD_00415 [Acidobacteriota bacterium]
MSLLDLVEEDDRKCPALPGRKQLAEPSASLADHSRLRGQRPLVGFVDPPLAQQRFDLVPDVAGR